MAEDIKFINVEELVLDKMGKKHVWVSTPVIINPNDFNIDQNKLEEEACTLPQKIVFYGELYAKTKAQLSRKEDEVKRVYAFEAIKIREQNDTAGTKTTESKIKEQVDTSDGYHAATQSLSFARKDCLIAESWYKSINKKVDLLIMLGYKQNTELKNNM